MKMAAGRPRVGFPRAIFPRDIIIGRVGAGLRILDEDRS